MAWRYDTLGGAGFAALLDAHDEQDGFVVVRHGIGRIDGYDIASARETAPRMKPARQPRIPGRAQFLRTRCRFPGRDGIVPPA